MRTRLSSYLLGAAAAALVLLSAVGAGDLAWAGGPPPRGEPAQGPPPMPLVLQFRHIPAESFLDTLKQLARNPQVAEVLEQIPIALNQPANAVVMLVSPEAAEFLMAIAKGLDQPNEFREIMRQQEQQEMEFRMKAEAMRRYAAQPPMPMQAPAPPPAGRGGPRPGTQMGPGPRGPGGMMGCCPNCPMSPQGPQPGARMAPGPQGPGAMMGRGQAGPVRPQAAPNVRVPVPPASGPRMESRPPEGRSPAGPVRPQAAPNVRVPVPPASGPRMESRPPEGRESPRREPGRGLREGAGPASPARFYRVQDTGGPPPGMAGQGPPPMWGGMMEMFTPEERGRISEMMQRGRDLRFLDDPDVRSELKINPQQEQKIQDLRDRAQALFTAISGDVQARIRDHMPTPDMPEEARQAAIDEIRQIVVDTVRGALNEVETMMGEATALLTDEQKAMLKLVGPQRTQTEQLVDGLFYLTTSRARDEFKFSYDQSEKIKMIVRDVEVDLKKVREEIAGPGKEPTAEELRSEKFAPFRDKQKEFIKKALDRIMTILTTDQREQVQKWADTRMNRSSGSSFMRRRPGGGPEGARPGGPPEGARPGGPPEGPPPGSPPGGAQAPGVPPSVRPAVYESSARFILVEEGGPPSRRADGPPRAGAAERGPRIDSAGAAGLARLLFDPEVRDKLRLTPDQERKIAELEARGKAVQQRVRDDMAVKFGPPGQDANLTPQEREARRAEVRAATEEATRAANREMQALMNELSTVLTDEQKAQLREIARQRSQSETATGGLAFLTTQRARDEFGFSSDQVAKIKDILRDLEEGARRLRDEAAGPARDAGREGPGSETAGPLREQHKEMVKKALGRILSLLTGDQREKVQRWADMRMNAGPGGPARRPGPPQAEPATKGYGNAAA